MGDRIRVVRLPSGIDAPGYVFHADTRALYERLIRDGRPHTIWMIDAWGLPWIQRNLRARDGKMDYHCLAMNDDSWVRVVPRASKGQGGRSHRGPVTGAKKRRPTGGAS